MSVPCTSFQSRRGGRLYFNKFLKLVALVASAALLASCSASAAPEKSSANANQDLYGTPADTQAFIERAKGAAIKLMCDKGGLKTERSGSAWHIEIAGKIYLITNAHVIEPCIHEGDLFVYDSEYALHLVKLLGYWFQDGPMGDRDVAVLTGRDFGEPLQVAINPPEIGHWVLSAGWPSISGDPYQQLSMGHVMGIGINGTIVSSAVSASGMSGGPLLNSAGEVVGIHYATMQDGSSRALAQPISNLCDVALVCDSSQRTLTPLRFPEQPVTTYEEED